MKIREQVGLMEALIFTIGSISIISLLVWVYSHYCSSKHAHKENKNHMEEAIVSPIQAIEIVETTKLTDILEEVEAIASTATPDHDENYEFSDSWSDFISSRESLFPTNSILNSHPTTHSQIHHVDSIASDDWKKILNEESSKLSSSSSSSLSSFLLSEDTDSCNEAVVIEEVVVSIPPRPIDDGEDYDEMISFAPSSSPSNSSNSSRSVLSLTDDEW
jgi:hypothetical protein